MRFLYNSILILVFLTFAQDMTAQIYSEDYRLTPEPYLLADSCKSYGKSVDISGDYAVVGATTAYEAEGAAYVLFNNGTFWEVVARLTPSMTENNTAFGYSVSMYDTIIVVGTHYGDVAYVFVKPTTGWKDMTETAILRASEEEYGYSFGRAVKNYKNAIVVGAPYSNNNFGSVYVFEMPAAGWVDTTETAKLTMSKNISFSAFSYDVSISENVIIASARGENIWGENSGSAYVFEKPVDGWQDMTETAKLTPSGGSASDLFSSSISIYSDIIAIGAASDNENAEDAGAAYLFQKPAGGWSDMTETVKLMASDGSLIDGFGASIKITDERIIIGAPNTFYKGVNTGSAYIFTFPTDDLTNATELSKIMPSDTIQNGQFGHSLNYSDSVIILGAPGNGSMLGSTYFYNLPLTNIFDSSQTSSISNIQRLDDDISVYPNPTKADIQYNLPENITIKQFEVYSWDGRKVIQKTKTNSNHTINFAGFINGVYFIVFYSNDKMFVKKVMKE